MPISGLFIKIWLIFLYLSVGTLVMCGPIYLCRNKLKALLDSANEMNETPNTAVVPDFDAEKSERII